MLGMIVIVMCLVFSLCQMLQLISVIICQEMNDFGFNGIDDVMKVILGISIVIYDSECIEYYVCGFVVQNFQYDGILMVCDLVYLVGNMFSDIVIYDCIEVFKGVIGLLIGMGDFGVMINLVCKKLICVLVGSVMLGVGLWDSYWVGVDVGGLLIGSGCVCGCVVVVYQDKQFNVDYYQCSNEVFYGILEIDIGDSMLLMVGVDYQDSDFKGLSWGGILLLDSVGKFNCMLCLFNNGVCWSCWGQYVCIGFVMLEYIFGNDWVVKLQFNYQVNGYDVLLGVVVGGNFDFVIGEGVSMWLGQYIGKIISNVVDLYVSGWFEWFGCQYELVVGGSVLCKCWVNNGYLFQLGYVSDVVDYYVWIGDVFELDWQWSYGDNQVIWESGVYVVGCFDLVDLLKLIFGSCIVNYIFLDIDESGVVVLYVGVVYDFSCIVLVFVSYSIIFKLQGNQDEQGWVLDLLEGCSYEVGLKVEFYEGCFNVSVVVFQLEQDNYVQFIGGRILSGGIVYEGLMGVWIRGYELEIFGQFVLGWQVQGGYVYKIVWQQFIKVFMLELEDQFSVYSIYCFIGVGQGWSVGGGVCWQGSMFGIIIYLVIGGSQVYCIELYWLLDVMVCYQFNDQLLVMVNVNNLFDKCYYMIFSWYSIYIWGELCNVCLMFNYRF